MSFLLKFPVHTPTMSDSGPPQGRPEPGLRSTAPGAGAELREARSATSAPGAVVADLSRENSSRSSPRGSSETAGGNAPGSGPRGPGSGGGSSPSRTSGQPDASTGVYTFRRSSGADAKSKGKKASKDHVEIQDSVLSAAEEDEAFEALLSLLRAHDQCTRSLQPQGLELLENRTRDWFHELANLRLFFRGLKNFDETDESEESLQRCIEAKERDYKLFYPVLIEHYTHTNERVKVVRWKDQKTSAYAHLKACKDKMRGLRQKRSTQAARQARTQSTGSGRLSISQASDTRSRAGSDAGSTRSTGRNKRRAADTQTPARQRTNSVPSTFSPEDQQAARGLLSRIASLASSLLPQPDPPTPVVCRSRAPSTASNIQDQVRPMAEGMGVWEADSVSQGERSVTDGSFHDALNSLDVAGRAGADVAALQTAVQDDPLAAALLSSLLAGAGPSSGNSAPTVTSGAVAGGVAAGPATASASDSLPTTTVATTIAATPTTSALPGTMTSGTSRSSTAPGTAAPASSSAIQVQVAASSGSAALHRVDAARPTDASTPVGLPTVGGSAGLAPQSSLSSSAPPVPRVTSAAYSVAATAPAVMPAPVAVPQGSAPSTHSIAASTSATSTVVTTCTAGTTWSGGLGPADSRPGPSSSAAFVGSTRLQQLAQERLALLAAVRASSNQPVTSAVLSSATASVTTGQTGIAPSTIPLTTGTVPQPQGLSSVSFPSAPATAAASAGPPPAPFPGVPAVSGGGSQPPPFTSTRAAEQAAALSLSGQNLAALGTGRAPPQAGAGPAPGAAPVSGSVIAPGPSLAPGSATDSAAVQTSGGAPAATTFGQGPNPSAGSSAAPPSTSQQGSGNQPQTSAGPAYSGPWTQAPPSSFGGFWGPHAGWHWGPPPPQAHAPPAGSAAPAPGVPRPDVPQQPPPAGPPSSGPPPPQPVGFPPTVSGPPPPPPPGPSGFSHGNPGSAPHGSGPPFSAPPAPGAGGHFWPNSQPGFGYWGQQQQAGAGPCHLRPGGEGAAFYQNLPQPWNTTPTYNPYAQQEFTTYKRSAHKLTFNGQLQHYPQFRSRFLLAVHNLDIPISYKYNELYAAVEEQAPQICNHALPGAGGYALMVTRLEEEFGGLHRQLSLYTNAIRHSPQVKAGDLAAATALVQAVEGYQFSLPHEQRVGPQAYSHFELVSDKLSTEVRAAYWSFCRASGVPDQDLGQLVGWLKRVFIDGLRREAERKKAAAGSHVPRGRAHLAHPVKDCPICMAQHSLDQCPEFARKHKRSRKNTIVELRRCIRCLAHGHMAKNCTASGCADCGKNHHELLHRAFVPLKKPAAVPAATSSMNIMPSAEELERIALTPLGAFVGAEEQEDQVLAEVADGCVDQLATGFVATPQGRRPQAHKDECRCLACWRRDFETPPAQLPTTVSDSAQGDQFFLPHFRVVQEDKATTKVRVVLNGRYD